MWALLISFVLVSGAAPVASSCALAGVHKELWEASALPGPPFDAPLESDLENTIGLTVPHGFSQAEAQVRVSQLLAYWGERFGVTSVWRGDRVCLSGSILGKDIEAIFLVTGRGVRATAKDPGWPWRGRIRSYVDGKLKKYLHPTYEEP